MFKRSLLNQQKLQANEVPKAIPSVSPRIGQQKPPILPISQMLKQNEIEGKSIQNVFEIKKPMTPVIAEPSPRFGMQPSKQDGAQSERSGQKQVRPSSR
jgi:hypothetical protein